MTLDDPSDGVNTPPRSEQQIEKTHTDVRTLEHVEYGVRDLFGFVVTMPEWRSPAEVVEALHCSGYRAFSTDDVIARTTTTTVTTTGWEAIS